MLNLECLWNPPPSVLDLNSKEVHVWRAHLNLPGWQIQELEHTLSSDERLRAERFVFKRDRRRFIVGRGLLRNILSRYLNLEPIRLEFCYSPRGKPELTSRGPNGKPCFNLSHSNEMAVYAITHNRSVGIDIEHIRPVPDMELLAKRFFYPNECAVVSSLPLAEKQEEFFKGWTVKEAYLKATGEGLAGLNQVEVSLTPGKPAALLSIQGVPMAMTRWSSHQMKPSQGYVAALVLEGQEWYLSQRWTF